MTACGENFTEYVNDSTSLKIHSVEIENEAQSRTALWNTTFPIGSSIGVALYNNNSGTQAGEIAQWSKSSTAWTTPVPMPLENGMYTAYAYYPYSPDIKDLKNIPINYNQSDYMTAVSEQKEISNATGKNEVSFIMKHIMTRMALRVNKSPLYKEAGRLTYMAIRNAPNENVMPTDYSLLTFNALNGEITHHGKSGKGTSLELKKANGSPVEYPIGLTTNFQTEVIGEIVLAPFTFEDGEIEIFLIIDGTEFVISVPKPSGLSISKANGGWNTGHNYRYNLTVLPKHIAINSITVNDWVEIF